MTRNLNYLVSLLLVANLYKSTFNSNVPLCPQYCKCSIFMGMRHASCIGQRLPNIDTDVPSNVQILDLSNNTISNLERKAFKALGLTSLYKIQLQYNHIGSIDLHAFVGVTQLRILDLSFNHLYYILPGTFEDSPHLQHLYLKGNRLKFYNGPILIISTLEVLDLSSCQIDNLQPESFVKLPALKSLNLTHNQLIRLDTQVLEPLQNLNKIGLDRNPWSCDGNAHELEARLNNLNIQHTPICDKVKQSTGDKFQKMISAVNMTDYDSDAEIMSDYELIKIWNQNDAGKIANIEKTDHRMCNNNNTASSKIGNVFDKIPSLWCIMIGFEIGCVFGGIFMWILLRLQQTRTAARPQSFTPILALQHFPNTASLRRLRSTGEETAGLCDETDIPDCPGTPPPPYRELFNSIPRRNEDTVH